MVIFVKLIQTFHHLYVGRQYKGKPMSKEDVFVMHPVSTHTLWLRGDLF